MKATALAQLCLTYFLFNGCSDDECAGDQRKIGTICIDVTRTDAGSARAGDGGAYEQEDRDEDVSGSFASRDGSSPGGDGGRRSDASSDGIAPLSDDGGQVAPASNSSSTADADASTVSMVPVQPPKEADPTTPAQPACVPGMEVCDGKDNNCNSQIDEDAQGATTWFRDCDGDGFAASKTGSVVGCSSPALAGTCKAWVDTSPDNASTTDCDDTSPVYKPGATYGLPSATNSSNDLNCDGKVETQITLRSSTGLDLYVCPYAGNCECYQPFFRNGVFMQDWGDWRAKGTQSAIAHPPIACASSSDDVIGAYRFTTGPEKALPDQPGCFYAITTSMGVGTAVVTKAQQLCR